jgi:hypothetical protein
LELVKYLDAGIKIDPRLLPADSPAVTLPHPGLERAQGFLWGTGYTAGMSDQPSPGRPGRRGWPGRLGWRHQPGQPSGRDYAVFAIILCLAVIGIALGLIFKLW